MVLLEPPGIDARLPAGLVLWDTAALYEDGATGLKPTFGHGSASAAADVTRLGCTASRRERYPAACIAETQYRRVARAD